jgi:hypothetical protein
MKSEDVGQFAEELERHIVSLGADVSVLSEQSGVRFPLLSHFVGDDRDWETLCYLSFWLRMQHGVLPDEFVSRMVLGPPNKWVNLLFHVGLHKK